MEKYQVFNKNGNYEYDIVVDGTDTSMYRSHGSEWSPHVRGELVLYIVDDGNGVKFGKNIKTLQYDEIAELFIMLSFLNTLDPMYEGEILQTKTFKKIS